MDLASELSQEREIRLMQQLMSRDGACMGRWGRWSVVKLSSSHWEGPAVPRGRPSNGRHIRTIFHPLKEEVVNGIPSLVVCTTFSGEASAICSRIMHCCVYR